MFRRDVGSFPDIAVYGGLMVLRLSLKERLAGNKLPVPILDAFGNVLFGRALMVCNSRGVFDALCQTPHSSEELAVKLQLSPQGAEVLLRAMEAGGYVVRKRGLYRNSRISERWLTRTSPHYIGNLVQYFEALFPRWRYLGETVERGAPEKSYFEFFSDADWETYVYAMKELAQILMPQVLERVVLAENAHRLLDLGGSHGLYAIELCKRYPRLSAEVLDFGKAVEIGMKIGAERGMSARVSYRAGDFKRDMLGDGYDVVLAFNIIHGLNPTENLSLLKKIAGSLNSSGSLFMMDQFRENRRGSSLSSFIPAIVGLNLFNEIGGNTYAYHEIKQWCDEARLVGCAQYKLRVPGVTIIRAKKP